MMPTCPVKSLKLLRILALSLPPFILLAPVYLTGKAIFWGLPALQFVPWWVQAWTNVQQGGLPLWNPLVGMGAPLLANYQLAFFYPPNWLYLVAAMFNGTAGIAWMQAPLMAMHLAWAGLGTAYLARELRLTPLAQAVAGLSFGLSGYLVSRAWFLSINVTVAWLPWVLLGTLQLSKSMAALDQGRNQAGQPNRMLKPWLLLSFSIAMLLLGGHAQTAWYTLLLASIWLVYWVIEFNKTKNHGTPENDQQARLSHRIAKVLSAFILAGLLAILLSAIQLIPTAEYLLLSQRASQVDFDQAMVYSFWPWRLLGLFAPEIFGSPVAGDYWGYATYWEDALYIGLIPVLLAMFTFVRRDIKARHRRLRILLLFISLISLLLAFGNHTPLYKVLYDFIPTFDLFQSPARWSIWAVFALSLFAAIGADYWQRPTGRSLYWARLGLAGMLAVTLGSWLAWVILQRNTDILRLATMVDAIALAGLWGICLFVLTLTAPVQSSTQKYHQTWGTAVLIVIVCDLLIAGWGLNPGIDLDFYQNEPEGTPYQLLSSDSGRSYITPDLEQHLKYDQLFKFSTFNATDNWMVMREFMLPNINILDSIPSANNFDPLLPARYLTWMEQLITLDDAELAKVLNLMGVKLVERMGSNAQSKVEYSVIHTSQRYRWFGCAVGAMQPDESLEKSLSIVLTSDPPLVIERPGSDTMHPCDPQQQVQIEIVQDESVEILLKVRAESPGWLYQADVWYPGWQAWVNGMQVKIEQANYLFRAVALPAGESEIRLVYQPVWLVPAMITSVSAWLAWLWVWLTVKKSEKQLGS
jgi:hypothetical protein